MSEITDIGMCRCVILDYYCKVGGAVVDKFAASSKKWRIRSFYRFYVRRNIPNVESLSGKEIVAGNTTYLSQKFNLNRKTIQRDLLVLRSAGLIQWIGSAKNGHWEIVGGGE